jgi:hypothetical protein
VNTHVLFLVMGKYVTSEDLIALIELFADVSVDKEDVAVNYNATHASIVTFIPVEKFQRARMYLKKFDLEVEINEIQFQMIWM